MSVVGAAALAAGTGALVARLVLPLLVDRAGAWGLVDRPGGRKRHQKAVPVVGGLAVSSGAGLGAVLGGAAAEPAVAVFAGLMMTLVAVGVWDDREGRSLTPWAKAAWTALVLLLAAAMFGVPVSLPGAARVVVAFLVLHSFNTSDNANGLCGGIALLAATALALLAGAGTERVLHAALAGAVLGFLTVNFPSGKVFLGDAGSLLAGGWVACTFLRQGDPLLLLLAAVPLADLVSVSWLRLRAGSRPWWGDRRHVSHRLAATRLGETGAVGVLITLQAGVVGGMLILEAASITPEHEAWISGGFIAILALLFLVVPHRKKGAARSPHGHR